jgi:hypothetical protein
MNESTFAEFVPTLLSLESSPVKVTCFTTSQSPVIERLDSSFGLGIKTAFGMAAGVRATFWFRIERRRQAERLRRQVSQPIIHTNLVISLSLVN